MSTSGRSPPPPWTGSIFPDLVKQGDELRIVAGPVGSGAPPRMAGRPRPSDGAVTVMSTRNEIPSPFAPALLMPHIERRQCASHQVGGELAVATALDYHRTHRTPARSGRDARGDSGSRGPLPPHRSARCQRPSSFNQVSTSPCEAVAPEEGHRFLLNGSPAAPTDPAESTVPPQRDGTCAGRGRRPGRAPPHPGWRFSRSSWLPPPASRNAFWDATS